MKLAVIIRLLFGVIVVTLNFNTASLAQKTLFLKPSLGIQFPYVFIKDSGSAESSFKVNPLGFTFSYDLGLSFQLDVTSKNSFVLGWNNTGFANYSYRFGAPQLGVVTKSSSVSTLNVFPIGFMREIGVAKWFRLTRSQKTNQFKELKLDEIPHYLILFKIKSLLGLSYYRLQKQSGDNSTSSPSFGDAIVSNQIESRNNLALFGGFTFQFFNYDKDLLQLTLLYSQGLFNQVTTTIDYRLDTQTYDYHVVLGSRGSYFTIQLAYPIKIWRSKGF